MKTSKAARKEAVQEECGVWLDTAQLKVKAKQKRLPHRPISKLLNPFAEGTGYSLAVALNFTQTKMEMPKTKQSSISTFFRRQPKDLNAKSTSDKPNTDLVQASSSASTSTAPAASGTKRRRGALLEYSDSDPGLDKEWESENVNESEATLEHGEAAPTSNSFCESEEEPLKELNPPQSKRRFTDTSFLPDDSQPLPQAWSQDPLFTYSQFSDSESFLSSQKNTAVENFSDCFLDSRESVEDFGFHMNLKGKTSTQKSSKYCHSSRMDDDKENSRYLFSKSPCKRSPFSHIEPVLNNERTEAKSASPRKLIKDQLWERAEDENSQFKWTKPSSSTFKKSGWKQQSREADEDSLAVLFTQDSEGFKVIAHRGLQVRSPHKDPSYLITSTVRTSTYKSVEGEEDDMLFTQDSQGNMVIRH